MKPVTCTRQAILASARILFALALVTNVLGAPTLNSVLVAPTPLIIGQAFSVTVSGSSDVVQGVAMVDFRPWATRLLRVTLSKQGDLWVGGGSIPADLLPPGGAAATVKVLLFDAARQRVEATAKVLLVTAATPSAVFNPITGVLTILGDGQDNDLSAVRDGAGNILVNGGAIAISGGAPTVVNTVLIQAFGFAGADQIRVDQTGGALPPVHFHGGAGDDLLMGGPTADLLAGDSGKDTLIAGGGNDVASGGDDDDLFIWNPGDGSDVIDGQNGHDALQFNGSNVGETVDLSANGGRLQFFRNVANVVMDVDDVEQVLFRAFGGADSINVNDLSGTDVTEVNLDLDGLAGLGNGDGQPDRVIVHGTAGDDVILIVGAPHEVSVLGLATAINLAATEAAGDQLVLNALAGDDVIEGSGLAAGAIGLIGDGGADNDVLIGSDGPDVLLGGDGDDVLIGGLGVDVLDGGPGDNIVIQ